MSDPAVTRPGEWPSWLKLLLCVLLVAAVAGVGGRVTAPEIPGWYAGLAKPAFTPPDRVFPVAWTTLYVAMALSLWRLWRAPPGPLRRVALASFLLQLTLNLAWSPVFFGLHAPRAALVLVLALAVVLAFALRAAFRVDAVAGWLLVPYMAWICFATALNAGIVALN